MARPDFGVLAGSAARRRRDLAPAELPKFFSVNLSCTGMPYNEDTMPGRDQLRRILEIDRRVRSGIYPHPEALATELEVSRRVIFNDRAYMLNVLGAPLEFHPQHRGWYYTEPNFLLPSAMVTRGELLSFILAVEAAQRQLEPTLQAELRRAIDKIAGSLQGHVGVELETLRQHFSIAPLANASPSEGTLLTLYEAMNLQKAVEMTYLTASRGQRSRRCVEPYHLHNQGGDWYLLAFDCKRKEVLMFNAGRIETLQILSRCFTRQADFTPAQYLQGGFRTELGPQVYDVAIRFDAPQAIYIRERHWHDTQHIEELVNGALILHFRASGLGEIKRWVMQYGAHAEVLSPPQLRQEVQNEIEALQKVYGRERNE
ncbi:MAG: hypothetical protein JWN98_2014 [Abditibacteriota bacterium]|nr:hypothetical protein [Abditibacteriota bacterium]